MCFAMLPPILMQVQEHSDLAVMFSSLSLSSAMNTSEWVYTAA